MLQRKELERQLTLDYTRFPAQPCVRSLYYLSKIAQTQSLKIIVPPTVLLGFNDDNRLMYNDYQTGLLVVESKNISPKRIQQFIQTHMIDVPGQATIEEKLLCPKFMIKLAGKGSVSNDMKIFYSKEAMIPELLSLWGSYDLALQSFVKQRHPLRPSMYRLFVNKNGHVYKAFAVNNQENMNKDSKLHKLLLQLVEDAHNKSKAATHQRLKSEVRTTYNPHIVGGDIHGFGGARHSISVGRAAPKRQSIFQTIDQFNRVQDSNTILEKRRSIIYTQLRQSHQKTDASALIGKPTEEPTDLTGAHYTGTLNAKGFPSTLDHFKLGDYYSSISQSVPNSDLKKTFTCTSDNIENLTMMNCRPSALQQASLMTTDLYRLFSQYYLKIQKFGHLSQFVCDFIEDHNGLMYLLQVKSFECEGVLYDWQMPFQPTPSTTLQQHIALLGNSSSPVKAASIANLNVTSEQLKLLEEKQIFEEMESKCQAHLLCRENKHQPALKQWFIQVCKERELWEFGVKHGHVPMVQERQLLKYRSELEQGKECFCLQSEKNRISTFFPLTAFCDRLLTPSSPSKMQTQAIQPGMKKSVSITLDPQQASQSEEPQDVQGTRISESSLIPACFSCYKLMELFSARYYALVFKTEQTVDELRKLKLKLVNHWTLENISYLLGLYKEAKKSLYIVSDIEKIERRVFVNVVRQRAKSPESVMRRSIRNQRRPQSAFRQTFLKSEVTGQKSSTFDQAIEIKHCERVSTAPKSKGKRSLLRSSKSLIRSIDRFQKMLEETQPDSLPITPLQHSNNSKGLIGKKGDAPFPIESADVPYQDIHSSPHRREAKVSAEMPGNLGTQPLPSNQSSQFSSRNIPQKRGSRNGGKSSILSLLTSSIHQRSDRDMNEYFNQKREMNRVLLTQR